MDGRKNLPEEGELLICTITNIQYHSVFAKIEAYGSTGMIHISEIAAGRIRNINDYVKVGKVVVCKVLRIHPERGHIDLSLRRVTESQRREKINDLKREGQAKSIIDFVAKDLKVDSIKLNEEVSVKLLEKARTVFLAFEDVVEKKIPLSEYGITGKVQEKLEEIIKQRIKPKEVLIKGDLELRSYDPDGLSIVKAALKLGIKEKGTDIRYLGGGKYKLEVNAKEYKTAEATLKKSVDSIVSYMKDNGGQAKFTRDGKSKQ
ncbi:S1 RNA-binding domain-containing protein [archaeon]|jgi:translation initiation factor 2 subunit 1|nr:S1 RNA-binding domain-containing protein [archaeon]MBT4648495.1 S1 RNA-binding domain-containing protein [archaeon]MBT6821607.1 S1 RNA-binding domain-containing protein [archaeon]MBT7392493.1 S1 RNA-binding domain-containing protein [archaeon]